jgi:hypothetical protein
MRTTIDFIGYAWSPATTRRRNGSKTGSLFMPDTTLERERKLAAKGFLIKSTPGPIRRPVRGGVSELGPPKLHEAWDCKRYGQATQTARRARFDAEALHIIA